jgi:dihydroorotase
MSDSIALHEVRVIDPYSEIDKVCDLFIVDGVLSTRARDESESFVQVDCRGLVATPAFIDIHCHLREPGFEYKETIRSGTAAAAAGGFGTVCCMPNTSPPLDTPERIRSLLEIASRDAVVNVLPIATVTVGRLGQELADIEVLADAGAVGFSDDGDYVLDACLMRDALLRAGELGVPVIDHAQDGRLVSGGVLNEGLISLQLGLSGMPPEAEELAVCRDIALSRMTGAHVHIAHVTTARAVEMIRRAKEDGLLVSAEATPHHMTLTEEDAVAEGPSGLLVFKNNAKVNPPLRTAADSRAVVRGLAEGVIDAVATDHAPHASRDKSGSPGDAAFGISGFETALGSVLTMFHRGDISLARLVHCLTAGPAGVIGVCSTDVGLFEKAVVDLVLFDPELVWTVESARFLSKGRNTPLERRSLRGKVLTLFVGGRCVYVENTLLQRCSGGQIEVS